MLRSKYFILVFTSFLLFLISSCNKNNVVSSNDLIELKFNELTNESIPPCLNYDGGDAEFVIRSDKDFDSIKIIHAPQGEYEDFIANGVQKKL